jgi:mRNA interferase MazF
MKAIPQPGEVYSVDFGYDGKVRYAVVVSVPAGNSRLAVSSVLQITTQYAGTPFEVSLPRVPWLREQSYCNAQTVQPVKWVEFQRKIGMFEATVVRDIRAALSRWLAI